MGCPWILYDGVCSSPTYCREKLNELSAMFPTCQVRVVRFYVSCLLLPRPPPLLSSSSPPPLLLLLLVVLLLVVLLVLLVQLRPAIHSVLCRTSTTTIHVSVPCRTSTTTIHVSVPCRTSTMTIHAQCSLPDLNHDHPRPVFPAGPQPRPSTPSVPCRTSTASIHAKCFLPDLMRYAR